MILENLPTPIEILLDPISLLILGIYLTLMIWEKIAPARPLPKIKHWKTKGLVAFALFFYLSTYLPLIWDAYLFNFQLFDLNYLGTYQGAALGILIYEMGIYIWHRSMHSSNFLWRVFHQMHHSSERIDSYGAFFFSPLDMIGFTFLGSLCLVVIAGFTAEASTLILIVTTFLSIFQHSNIKTPRWLGYVIQRPEAHSYHHAKGIHAFNYSDFPMIDILFGTFKNPKSYDHDAGFYLGGSSKIKDMLLFKDISGEESKTS